MINKEYAIMYDLQRLPKSRHTAKSQTTKGMWKEAIKALMNGWGIAK
jgi:hypothetical protein